MTAASVASGTSLVGRGGTPPASVVVIQGRRSSRNPAKTDARPVLHPDVQTRARRRTRPRVSSRWPTTASGATKTCPCGWGFPGGRKTGIRETRGRSSATLMGCLTRTSAARSGRRPRCRWRCRRHLRPGSTGAPAGARGHPCSTTAESPTGSTAAARTRGTRPIMGYIITTGPARHSGCGKRRSSRSEPAVGMGPGSETILTQRLAERSRRCGVHRGGLSAGIPLTACIFMHLQRQSR